WKLELAGHTMNSGIGLATKDNPSFKFWEMKDDLSDAFGAAFNWDSLRCLGVTSSAFKCCLRRMRPLKNRMSLKLCMIAVEQMLLTPPTDITGTSHDALFYQTELPGSNRFKFVFSVDTDKVLGVVKENDLYKLTLLPKVDDVDTRVAFVVK
uniref:Uncharacterized protein n=1 Tax=Oreochromis aureus TaxID=47969 RepID=A0AAZ1Y3W5_OREAU